MVLPSACRRSNRAMISLPVCESKFPVGSSARMIDGLFTSALAIATLDAEIHAAQRVHLLFRSHVVGLPKVLGRDHRRFGRCGHCGLIEINDFCGGHPLLLVL